MAVQTLKWFTPFLNSTSLSKSVHINTCCYVEGTFSVPDVVPGPLCTLIHAVLTEALQGNISLVFK